MDLDQFIDDWALPVLNIAAELGVAAFVILFSRVRWHGTAVGRALMWSAIAVSLITTGGMMRRIAHWTGDDRWSDSIGDALMAGGWAILAIAYTWRTVQLWRMSRGHDAHSVAPGLDRD